MPNAKVQEFDAIIIGAGQAGPSLAQRLAGAGWHIALLERGKFGGTCVNTGCIPTKAMVASAYAAHLARRAAEFGIQVSGLAPDFRAIQARKAEISAQSRIAVETAAKSLQNCRVFTAHAKFTKSAQSAHEIEAGGELLRAPKVFLDVGCRARTDIAGRETTPYLTNSSMMTLDVLPEHLVIVGGGPIGLEFGQMFRRFGSEVTIVERSARIANHEDEDVADAMREILETEGVAIHTGASCIAIARSGTGIAVKLDCKDAPPEAQGSHVLLAAGRKPNTDDLGLENVGVETDAHGFIRVDDQLRTNVEGIWALGECNGRGGFTHTSYNDYEIVAANLLDGDARRLSDRITTYGTFIDPPLGRAGMTEREVRAWMKQTGKKALIGRRPMTRVSRAIEKGETQGFMKILVDAESKRILGAAILGTGGDEAIHSILDVMYAKQPYTVISRAVHIHPTVCELIPTMLQDLKPLE